jgi:hypothetical protein
MIDSVYRVSQRTGNVPTIIMNEKILKSLLIKEKGWSSEEADEYIKNIEEEDES